MKYRKEICSKCGCYIAINNYKRHFEKCDGSYSSKCNRHNVYKVDHDGLNCKFCDVLCKNLNSLTQHELRCSKNPNRKSFNNLINFVETELRGHTKYTSKHISKQCKTMRQKFESGFSYSTKGRKVNFEYLYEEHNNKEIEKWLSYVQSIDVTVPEHTLICNDNPKTYPTIKSNFIFNAYDFRIHREHDLVANTYLNGDLRKGNVVHHIDKNIKNNNILNLMVFISEVDHKRFHNSKYSWIIYDDVTHKFSCVMKKDKISYCGEIGSTRET